MVIHVLRGDQWNPAADDKALRAARQPQRSHAPGEGGGLPTETCAPGVALYLFLQQRGLEDPVGGACQPQPERRPEARQHSTSHSGQPFLVMGLKCGVHTLMKDMKGDSHTAIICNISEWLDESPQIR